MMELGKSEIQARMPGNHNITTEALVSENANRRKYLSTLEPASDSAGLGALLLFILLRCIVSSYSGFIPDFIPAKFRNHPQPHAENLISELSTGKLSTELTHILAGTSCRQGWENSEETGLKVEPQFEVIRSGENEQVYLATLSRNGISVSEPIPHHIFDDDIADHELAHFWLGVRRRLSSELRSREQT